MRWGPGNKHRKGTALLPILPAPTLLLLGDKTFNYRYLVPLKIPNVLIASSPPPRTSFHGKTTANSQGGVGENLHPSGSLPRGRQRNKGGRKSSSSGPLKAGSWLGKLGLGGLACLPRVIIGTRPGFWCLGLALPSLLCNMRPSILPFWVLKFFPVN